jgi:Helix-turn-helix domain
VEPLPKDVLEQAIAQINADALSPDDVAKLTGKHPMTIIRYIRKGRLRTFKVHHARLIWRDDAEAAR